MWFSEGVYFFLKERIVGICIINDPFFKGNEQPPPSWEKAFNVVALNKGDFVQIIKKDDRFYPSYEIFLGTEKGIVSVRMYEHDLHKIFKKA